MNRPRLEILDSQPTPLGELCLRRRELASQPGTIVTEVTLNHEFLMSSYHTASERALADVALEMHPGTALRVLVGGLGLGYTALEVLRSERVARVEVIEYLPQVIAWLDEELIPTAAELEFDTRLQVIEGDIYALLADPPERLHDVILIDVDHSPDETLDPSSASFYTVEGLRAARRHLAPGGVLGVWSYAANSPFSEALQEVFGDVRVECVTFENDLIGETQTDWLFFVRIPDGELSAAQEAAEEAPPTEQEG